MASKKARVRKLVAYYGEKAVEKLEAKVAELEKQLAEAKAHECAACEKCEMLEAKVAELEAAAKPKRGRKKKAE